MTPSHPSESSTRLLLDCVQTYVGARAALPPRIMEADGRTLIELAVEHRVAELLVPVLRTCAQCVAPSVWLAMRAARHRARVRSERASAQLSEVLRGCADRGLSILALKGASLARVAYLRPADRGFDDIDLLVRECEFAELRAFLESIGYRSAAPCLPPDAMPTYAQSVGQVQFVSPDRLTIEAHFRLFNAGTPEGEEPSWRDAIVERFGSVQGRLPDAERFLLHLIFHAQQHRYSYLRLLVDIAVWVQSRRPNLDRFWALATTHDLTVASHFALRWSGELLNLPALTAEATAHPPRRRTAALYSFLWDGRGVRNLRAQRAPRSTELPLAMLLGEGSLRRKCRYLRELLRALSVWRSPVDGGIRWHRIAREMRSPPPGIGTSWPPRREAPIERPAQQRVPVRRHDVQEQHFPEEIFLYDPVGCRAYLLNRSAAIVWQLMNGRRTDRAIARTIARAVGIAPHRARIDVSSALSSLSRDGLVTWRGRVRPVPEGRSGRSARAVPADP